MRKLLVRLLQFLLLRLKFAGELLRLLQQIFRAHRRLNRVEHDADGLRQLFEERQVRDVERLERREFNHRFRLAFKQHRQHNDARRARGGEARFDVCVIRFYVVEQDALLLDGALADETFADENVLGLVGPLRVTGEQTEHPFVVVAGFHLINRALLRAHERRQFGKQHLPHREQISLPLQHARKFRKVRFQPVLLLVALGRLAQIADHRVDVVLEFGDFAARFNLN